MRISDWSSDVCSSDLHRVAAIARAAHRGSCETFLVSGGMPDPTLHGLEGVRFAQLPPARAKDASLRILLDRSEERRVGKECVSTCQTRWSPSHYKKNKRK